MFPLMLTALNRDDSRGGVTLIPIKDDNRGVLESLRRIRKGGYSHPYQG